MRDKEAIKKGALEAVTNCLNDPSVTAWSVLDERKDGTFAIVAGYVDGFDERENDLYGQNGARLCLTIGFLPRKSMMTEYGIDWLPPRYPEDTKKEREETDEVLDAEVALYEMDPKFPNRKTVQQNIEELIDDYEKYLNECRTQVVHITDIKWDLGDLEDWELRQAETLPTEVFLPGTECRDAFGVIDEEKCSEYITNEYGFCHYGFKIATEPVLEEEMER